MRGYHRRAPFLFFNSNTFASIGREMALAIFSDLPAIRRREIGSVIAHYISGVLDCDAMVASVDSLWKSASLRTGDRVRTLKGSLRGIIKEILDDGRVKWRTEAGSELICLPEGLVLDERDGRA